MGRAGGEVERRVADKPMATFKQRVRQLTRRSGGRSMQDVVDGLRPYLLGWKAYFGRVLTPEELASLKDKLAALKSISVKVDYNSPDLEYVNVMNPFAPAVKLKSAKAPPAPAPSPAARATPSPPAPTVVPACA